MIHDKKKFRRDTLSEFAKNYLTEQMLLFDIETTGLSPERDFIYCIGCGYCLGDEICVELFFAQSPEDEGEVLSSFFVLASTHSVLLTFNGSTFDLPFIRKRSELLKSDPHLSDPTILTVCERFPESVATVDLYREVVKMKHLLGLTSYRQKSVEQFLGCDRNDQYDGGELTRIYLEYISHPDPEALDALLLHNREDVTGMFLLLSVLAYRQFPQGQFTITDIIEEDTDNGRWLNLKLATEYPLPQSIHKILPEATLAFDHTMSLVRLPLYNGTLKHFFDDPSDYYFLPEEDTAVHKSVGQFVDPAYRIKATKKTCYVKKNCDYLMFPVRSDCGDLKRESGDHNTYLEVPAGREELKHVLSIYFSDII